MASFAHRAMVWLGITDDDEELEMPIHSGESQRYERVTRPSVEDDYEDPVARSYEKALSRSGASANQSSRIQVVANGDHYGDLRDETFTPRSAPLKPVAPRVETPVEDMQSRTARTQVIRPIRPEGPKVHLAIPTRFADVQEIADHMIGGRPVIVNIEGLDPKVYRRIIDFCSGLTYAVGGKIRKVGEQVYLLTPSKVELADEEMERITERAVFRGGEL
jgi:FtsZ-interacting cell division protein YlmF